MTTASLSGTDLRLRHTVIRHLDWDPELDASAIGVAAHEGIVTLTGFVNSYAEKLAAERAVKRLRGVRAVANDIVVRLLVARTDEDIALDAARALTLRQSIRDTVQAVVHRGHLTLTGSVNHLVEKHAAEDLVRHIKGVVAVHNYVTVTPQAAERDIKRRITRALHQNADVDVRHIQVTPQDDRVILSGTVTTWSQRDAAELAAIQAPGVTQVDNHITVSPTPLAEDEEDEIC